MGLNLGKAIAVSTSYIKSNPAVPVYSESLYATTAIRPNEKRTAPKICP